LDRVRQPRLTPKSFAWLGVVISLFLTALAWQLARRWAEAQQAGAFALHSEEVRRAIAFRMDVYAHVLVQTAGFLAVERDTDRVRFRQYVAHIGLAAYPGVLGVGFAQRVAPGEKHALERRIRAEGFGQFRIWPAAEGTAYVVVLLEPFDERNQRAFGYDMSTDPVRREAMERAAATGKPSASGRVRLVQEPGDGSDRPGFLLYYPVRPGGAAAESIGFAYSPFRARDLFPGIFSDQLPATQSLGYRVYDGEARPETLLYDSSPGFEPREKDRSTLSIGGRTWVLELYGLPSFWRETHSSAPLLVLVVGLIVSAVVFRALLIDQRHALELSRLLHNEQEARAVAQSAVRSRDDVLAVVSHDLRNPVNSILLTARALSRSAPPEDERTHRMLSALARAADNMRLLLGDLTDLVRIDSGRLSVETRSNALAAIAAEAVELFGPIAAEKGVRLELQHVPHDLVVSCDRDRILQVFSNLLGNAVKFTPPGGSVTVSVADAGETVRVDIADTGPGLSTEEAVHVFDRFWQGRKTTAQSGTGLGLYIVRAIVAAHGGEVSVRSEPGKGATFSFTLRRVAA
jgi:signal transduction histidine kinase